MVYLFAVSCYYVDSLYTPLNPLSRGETQTVRNTSKYEKKQNENKIYHPSGIALTDSPPWRGLRGGLRRDVDLLSLRSVSFLNGEWMI